MRENHMSNIDRPNRSKMISLDNFRDNLFVFCTGGVESKARLVDCRFKVSLNNKTRLDLDYSL